MSSPLRARQPAPVRVVFDGQSMLDVPVPPNSFPTFLMAGRGLPWISVGVDGNGWLDLTPTVGSRLYRQARNRAGCTDVLILSGGQGDILNTAPNGQQSGATTYSRMVTYANNARAAGFAKVGCTTLPPVGPNVLGTGRPNGTEQTALTDLNVLILANSGGFDGVADISVAPLDDATNTAYFNVDRTHLTAAGAKAAAAIVAPMLDAILASL